MEISWQSLTEPSDCASESEQGVWKIIKLSFHCFIMNRAQMVQHNSC